MSLRHRKVVNVADDPAAAAKLRPSDWGSPSTDYDTAPTHVFEGGAIGALAMRDTGSVDGFSWVPSEAGVLVSDGDDEIPVFRALLAADIPALPYAPLDLTGAIVDDDIVSLAWSKLTDTPTTIGGYGITDFNSLGDARWDALGAAATVAGNLAAHAALTTTAHGLGASAFHPDAFFAAAAHVHSAADITTGTLAVDRGGTGLGAFVAGDIVYASGAAALSRLADVATGSVLVSGGVGAAPAWSATPTLSTVALGADISLRSVVSDLNGSTELTTQGALYIAHTADAGSIYMDQAATATAGAGIVGRRARGTAASPLDVANNDQLAYMDFRGYSGTKFWQTASVAAHVDGTFVSGQRPPSRLVFSTNVANAASAEAMRIDGKGRLLIHTQAVLGGLTDEAYLQVKSIINDWAVGILAAPASGAAFGLRIHTTPATSSDLPFAVSSGAGSGTFRVAIDGLGRVGIGTITPGAFLQLKAGTATAGTAPLKFISGVVLTAPVAGVVEFATDDYFATITTGAARKGIVLDDGARLTSGKIPRATTNGRLIDGPTPLAGTKTYWVSDSSGGAVNRKLTFVDGILTAEV